MSFLEELKEKISVIANRLLDALRHGRELVHVSAEKNRVGAEIRSRYEDLGRTIYESRGEDMSACREICDQIDALKEKEAELTAKDALLRHRCRCPRCGTPMNRKAKFCSACGAPMCEQTAEAGSEE